MLYESKWNYLEHYGVKGQKHGLRRFQNEDGSLTAEGREHYGVGDPRKAGGSTGRISKASFKGLFQKKKERRHHRQQAAPVSHLSLLRRTRPAPTTPPAAQSGRRFSQRPVLWHLPRRLPTV